MSQTIQQALDDGWNVVLYAETYRLTDTLRVKRRERIIGSFTGRMDFDPPLNRVQLIPAWAHHQEKP